MGTTVRYGLRNRKTGRLLGLSVNSNDDSDFCNPETCMFSERGELRYSTGNLTDVLAATRADTPWYNTDFDRPGWNGVDLSGYDVVAFVRTETFDAVGGDPVEVVERVLPVRLPALFEGEAMRTYPRKDFKAEETFGVSLPEDAWPITLLVRDPDGKLETGMMFNASHTGAVVVAAVADLPAHWPMDPGRPFDRDDRAWKLVLASPAPFRDPSSHVEGFDVLPLPADVPEAETIEGGPRP